MVRKKLEQLLENDCLTYIYNGVITVIPKIYALMSSKFFKQNEKQLHVFLDEFKPENLSAQDLQAKTKKLLD